MKLAPILQSFAAVAACAMIASVAQAAPEIPASLPTPVAREKPAYVILKIDDLRSKGNSVSAHWQKLVDFARERKIKLSIGILADSLEADNPGYLGWIKKQNATGQIEFWNHG